MSPRRPVNPCRNLLIVLALSLGLAPLPGRAADLMQVYRDALAYDAQYAAARFALQAGREKLPQGRALLLPSLNLTANTTDNHIDTKLKNPSTVTGIPLGRRSYNTNGYQLTLTQPLFRKQNILQYDEAGYQVKQAEATFGQAKQDLLLRVAEAYFNVLAAQDSLELVRAQKKAIAEQLAQAKRKFEVGTATIVDTREAQARADLANSQEIAAQNDLESKQRALEQLTGKTYPSLNPLRPDVTLSLPSPDNMASWVHMARQHAFPVRIGQTAVEVANLEAQRAQTGRYPTLDAVATYGYTSQTGSQVTTVGTDTNQASIGLQLSVPLFQGGAISSRAREAAANYEQSKEKLSDARRSAALTAQQSFLAVANGVSQVKALEQALVSSQSALQSNELGYQVGVRINIDVLNAQQQLYSTKRDLALARYNTITSELKLKAAAGSLTAKDLEQVNGALQH